MYCLTKYCCIKLKKRQNTFIFTPESVIMKTINQQRGFAVKKTFHAGNTRNCEIGFGERSKNSELILSEMEFWGSVSK